MIINTTCTIIVSCSHTCFARINTCNTTKYRI